uniref:Uncharacterized protein n=1 Tax=Periophthalmus magnuspinnatus TaxID=409849 RepID=A0A3B4A542_9GOBI
MWHLSDRQKEKDAAGAVKCCYFSCYYAPCSSTGLCLYDISYAAGVKVHSRQRAVGITSACRFATDRSDFRRLFADGFWVARNLFDFNLMSPQPVT